MSGVFCGSFHNPKVGYKQRARQKMFQTKNPYPMPAV